MGAAGRTIGRKPALFCCSGRRGISPCLPCRHAAARPGAESVACPRGSLLDRDVRDAIGFWEHGEVDGPCLFLDLGRHCGSDAHPQYWSAAIPRFHDRGSIIDSLRRRRRSALLFDDVRSDLRLRVPRCRSDGGLALPQGEDRAFIAGRGGDISVQRHHLSARISRLSIRVSGPVAAHPCPAGRHENLWVRRSGGAREDLLPGDVPRAGPWVDPHGGRAPASMP